MPFFWIYLAEKAINKPKIPDFGSDTSILSSSMLWKCIAKNLGNQNDLEVDIYDLTIFIKLIYILVADNMIFDLVQFSTQLLHFSSTVYLSTMFVVDVLLKNRDFICTYWGFRGNDHWKFITCLWALAKHQFGFDLGDEKKKKLNLVSVVFWKEYLIELEN